MTQADAFGVRGWTVQPSLDRIERDGRIVHLRPKTMDVLVCLAEQPGQVVSREAPVDRVWAKRFISDAALKTAVYELRQAFGDECRVPQVIETIPKRGYRLIAEVQRLGPQAEADTGGAETPFRVIYGERQIPLPAGETLIGRDPGAAVRIDSLEVSRRHARIVVADAHAVIEDLGSKNGTVVAGKRIDGVVELSSGDRIIVGSVALTFKLVGILGTIQTAEPPEHERRGGVGEASQTTHRGCLVSAR